VTTSPSTGLDGLRDLRPFDVSHVREQITRRPVVIFGAGNLGRRVLQTLRSASITPRAFADNNPKLWGQAIDSIPILNPATAASTFGEQAIFVIAVWHPAHSGGLRGIESQLRQLGCKNIVPFVHVLWSFPGSTLPHYLWDLPSKIEPEWGAIQQAHDLFEDEMSRAEFTAQVAFRLTGDFKALPPIQNHPQYFPPFLARAHRERKGRGAHGQGDQELSRAARSLPGAGFARVLQECFVDCGAYDGDSLADFLGWSHGEFQKVIAFEPDPGCFVKLQEFTSRCPESRRRIECRQLAVAAASGVVRFDATGQAGASISDSGSIEVKTVALDEALAGEEPTFIKMDIEGAEPDALRGARETIRRTRPILAICVYHQQNHLWRLPLLMKELLPEARFFLRSYCLDGLDTVCYAVPADRLTSDRGGL